MPKRYRTWTTWAAWLLCFVIVCASLDRIADPPAVNSHTVDTKALCLSHNAESPSIYQHQAWTAHLSAVLLEISSYPYKNTSEFRQCGTHELLVRQAADTSPPGSLLS
jgi:hypothetical protein